MAQDTNRNQVYQAQTKALEDLKYAMERYLIAGQALDGQMDDAVEEVREVLVSVAAEVRTSHRF